MSRFHQFLAVIAAASAGSLLLSFVGVNEIWIHMAVGLVAAIIVVEVTERFLD